MAPQLDEEKTVSNENRAAEDGQSTEHVDIQTREALQRWADALAITTEQLESAVKAVGTRVDCIKDYLTAGQAGRQQDG